MSEKKEKTMATEVRAKEYQVKAMAVVASLLAQMNNCYERLVELPVLSGESTEFFRALHRGAETLARFTRIDK